MSQIQLIERKFLEFSICALKQKKKENWKTRNQQTLYKQKNGIIIHIT